MELSEWLNLLKKTAETLSSSPENDIDAEVWEKDSGKAALKTLDQILHQSVSSGIMSNIEFNAFLRSILSQEKYYSYFIRRNRRKFFCQNSLWRGLNKIFKRWI